MAWSPRERARGWLPLEKKPLVCWGQGILSDACWVSEMGGRGKGQELGIEGILERV